MGKGWFHRLGVGMAADSATKDWKIELYWPWVVALFFIVLAVYNFATGELSGLISLGIGLVLIFYVEKTMGKTRHMNTNGRVKFFANYYGVTPYEVFTELMDRRKKSLKVS